jgi:cysteinyl-tRNA synthetase
MKLSIYDTLRREKVEFKPHDPSRVTMYVCGPTVYNFAHIGNARPVVVFDVLFRLLRHLAKQGAWDNGKGETKVVYARNITDVDDKINQKAMDEGVDISVITERFAAIYNEDMATLGALAPTHQPRVTQNMDAIIAQIKEIIDNGHAYVAEGHVLFDVTSFAAYGALSGRSLDDMIAGARVEVAPYKKNPQDFVLWKPTTTNWEPRWPSPWGEGRPGWHIECSAMIEAVLGLPIDIHGGGHDLIFPHHENEIAQGICAQHAHDHQNPEYARYWMHNGFLDFSGEKMSKSLGNVVLVHDLIKQYPGEVLRWALLSAHYRSPLDWNEELLERTRKELDSYYQTLRDAKAKGVHINWDVDEPDVKGLQSGEDVINELYNDLNISAAKSILFVLKDCLRDSLESLDGSDGRAKVAGIYLKAIQLAAKILGILQQDPEDWFKAGVDDDLTQKVEALLVARKTARAEKNWPEADRIRDELNALNIEVMDSASGVSWKIKSSVGG